MITQIIMSVLQLIMLNILTETIDLNFAIFLQSVITNKSITVKSQYNALHFRYSSTKFAW